MTREEIIAFMRKGVYKPLTGEELIATLAIKDTRKFFKLLAEMEAVGDVVLTRTGKYGLPDRMNLVVGRLQGNAKGFAFLLPDQSQQSDVYIKGEDLNGAMHNDRVIVRLNTGLKDARRPEGEVIRILERANTKLVGTYDRGEYLGFVVPDDPRIAHDIFIQPGTQYQPNSGDKVVVEVTQWPGKRRLPEGRIIEIIGPKDAPGTDIISIIRKYDLPEAFPKAVEREATALPAQVLPEEIAGRKDLRDLKMVTIDGEDAKDLDDAVSLEMLPNGNYRLGVHIADVSHYVRPGTALDIEALRRGTSVYLVDRVVPMLPPKLSNGICSLNPQVDRLAMSVFMEIDQAPEVVHYEIYPSVIHINERMTYKKVKQILVDHDPEMLERYAGLVEDFRRMEELCRLLQRRRQDRGSIDFDFPESKAILDSMGKTMDIIRYPRSIADQIIEEFMLMANEVVARHLTKLAVPALYRVHESPSPDKIMELNETLHAFGYHIKTVDNDVYPRTIQEVIQKVEGRPEQRLIQTLTLRSMRHARYAPEPLGHFGLAVRDYTHFTSPIRRYPDLIVHRVLKEVLPGGKLAGRRKGALAKMMPEIAEQTSAREKVAEEVERETVELKKVEYMQAFVGDVFEGIVSSVTSFGMFVELENLVEGLVHVSTLADDYYQFTDKPPALIGEHTRKSYKIGDMVKVKLVRVDVEQRLIDFELDVPAGAGARTRGNGGEAAARRGRRETKPGGQERSRKKTTKADRTGGRKQGAKPAKAAGKETKAEPGRRSAKPKPETRAAQPAGKKQAQRHRPKPAGQTGGPAGTSGQKNRGRRGPRPS